MKNQKSFLLIALWALIMAGCSGKKSEIINQYADLEGKVIGAVASAAAAEVINPMIVKYVGVEPREINYFNRGSDLVMALIAGKIDGGIASKFSADYYVKRNSNLKTIPTKNSFKSGVVMSFRSEDLKLKNDIDSVITILQGNGILKQLEDTWITNLPATDEPSFKELPIIDGANTIRVGVTGDYTPLDYIAADGRPAGYNVALLSEIAKILAINFEFVSLEAQAKFSALGSKKIDVVFCQTYNDELAPLFSDKTILSKPYYTGEELCILVRK